MAQGVVGLHAVAWRTLALVVLPYTFCGVVNMRGLREIRRYKAILGKALMLCFSAAYAIVIPNVEMGLCRPRLRGQGGCFSMSVVFLCLAMTLKFA